LNPNHVSAHYFYAFAFLAGQNRQTEAIGQMRTALSLDPLSSIVSTNYAGVWMGAHRHPQSLAQSQKVLDRDSGFTPAHYRYPSSMSRSAALPTR
jgi:predicted Zn-dependent protease